jgi:L-2-hydroxyglutarate oxidase
MGAGSAVDLAIVGGGIVGLAIARALRQARPDANMVLVEKESALGSHQTGHNSGVVHAGVYYAPGSMKAEFCREGSAATLRFCQEAGIGFERCGKLIVATAAVELERMAALEQRATANGLRIERLDAQALREREPHVAGLGALLVQDTAIVDYRKVAAHMERQLADGGVEIRSGTEVLDVAEGTDVVTLTTPHGEVRAKAAVFAAGLMADRLARRCGLADDFRIVPVRGEFYRLSPRCDDIVQHLIYPVPDPALPFLGVHLTRTMGGYVTVGPNAVFSMSREGYDRRMHVGDTLEALAFPGTWRLARKQWRSALDEAWSSISRRRYLALCQRYCPSLALADLQPHPPGIRAQAVMRDGSLVHDFLVQRTRRTVHVCNAPSPAATSALPIGRHVAALCADLGRD